MNQPRIPKRFVFVAGTFLISVLLYIDRACISAAKDPVLADLQFNDEQWAWILASFTLGYALCQVPSGWLADRFGHKLSLELGALASFLAFAFAWLAPSAGWYYVVFCLSGIALGAMIVSGILVIMEFCEPHRRPTYAGLANTGVGLVSMVAPLIGAWLAYINYSWLFALSAGVNLCALVAMRWFVREPRWARSSKLVSPPEILER